MRLCAVLVFVAVLWVKAVPCTAQPPLLEVDFAASERAKEGPGGHMALAANEGYDFFVSGYFGEGLAGRTLTVTVSAAAADGALLGIRLLLENEQRERLDSAAVAWNLNPGPDFSRLSADVAVTDPAAHRARVVLYRSNQQGIVYVRTLAVTLTELVPTEELAEALAARLADESYRVERTADLVIGRKDDERCYYHTFPGEMMKPEDFAERSYAGTTWLREEFRPPLFPIGPYIYGRPDVMRQRAEAMGMTLDQYFDHLARDVRDHGGNTIYYANLTMDPDIFKMAVAAAQRHGVSVFAQLTADLYLRPERGREHYETVTVPTARRIMPAYRDLPGVLAWMPKEEAAADEMQLVMEYRALLRELDPTHALYTLHNHLAPFQADTEHLPEWYGFDRYRFRYLTGGYGMLISTPKDMAIRLVNELRDYYAEAQKRGRPLVYVMQGYGHEAEFTTEDIRRFTGGAREDLDPWSGFREIRPGVWRGWNRYPPPKHGMCLQSWLAVLEGARGLLIYPYNLHERMDGMNQIALVDADGAPSRLWTEFAACMAKMRPLLPLILSWHKEALPRAQADNPDILVNSFIRRFDGERCLVVVNRRIATWDADSPALPRGETALHFDEHGLAGLHEAGPLTFNLSVEGEAPLWDLLSGERLVGQAGEYALAVEPGQGVVLFQGSAEALTQVRRLLD